MMLPSIRASYVHDFHITLAFLGEVTKEELSLISQQLRQCVFSTFSLTLADRVGIFPPSGRPRVIWIGVHQQHQQQQLQSLYLQIEKVLGLRASSFQAHITLARVKSRISQEEVSSLRRSLGNLNIEGNNHWTVSSFELKQSTLTSAGPLYTTLDTYKAGA